jgi:hypothetical protein
VDALGVGDVGSAARGDEQVHRRGEAAAAVRAREREADPRADPPAARGVRPALISA